MAGARASSLVLGHPFPGHDACPPADPQGAAPRRQGEVPADSAGVGFNRMFFYGPGATLGEGWNLDQAPGAGGLLEWQVAPRVAPF